jgi:hypothetical protein
MTYVIPFLVLFCISAAQTPQKIHLSDSVLDRLSEIEDIYRGLLASGVSPEQALISTMEWQEVRYPTKLCNPAPVAPEKKAKKDTK